MTKAAESDIVIRAKKKGQRVFKDFEASMQRLAVNAATLGAGAAAAAAGGLTLLTVQSFRNVDALTKKADKIGVATEKLAALNHLANLTGGSSQGMAEALTKATKRLGEFNATGGGAAAQWLQRLNLDTRELAELSPDELFARYAEEIRGLSSRGEQLAAMSALLGDESRNLIGVIDAGAEAMAAAEAETERFGTAISRVDAAKIEAANDAMFRVRQRAEGLGNVIASRVAPIITALANRMIETGAEAEVMGEAIDKVINGIAVGVGIVADAFYGWQLIFNLIRAGSLNMAAGMIGALADVEKAAIIVDNKLRSLYGGVQVDPNTGPLALVADSLRQSADEAEMLASKLAAGEKPSERIAASLQQARIDQEAAAQAAAKQRTELQAIDAPTFEANTKDEAAEERAQQLAEREEARARQALERVQQTLLEREQIEALAFIRRREVVEEAFQQELIDKDHRDELILGLERQFQDRLTKMAEAGYTERQKFARATLQAQASDVFSHLTQITQGVANHNKTLFRINQAAAIGNAIVNTYEGVTKTLAKYPWPLSGILAAAHLAAGLAQVQAIRSAQFGGGTTPSLAGGTPTFNDQPVTPSGTGDQDTGGRDRRIIEIQINGNIYSVDDFRDAVAGAVREAIDSDVIVISNESRQAEEIRAAGGSG